MMIHPQHTPPTLPTMMAPRWLPRLTLLTPPPHSLPPKLPCLHSPHILLPLVPIPKLIRPIRYPQPHFILASRQSPRISTYTPRITNPDTKHAEVEPECMPSCPPGRVEAVVGVEEDVLCRICEGRDQDADENDEEPGDEGGHGYGHV